MKTNLMEPVQWRCCPLTKSYAQNITRCAFVAALLGLALSLSASATVIRVQMEPNTAFAGRTPINFSGVESSAAAADSIFGSDGSNIWNYLTIHPCDTITSNTFFSNLVDSTGAPTGVSISLAGILCAANDTPVDTSDSDALENDYFLICGNSDDYTISGLPANTGVALYLYAPNFVHNDSGCPNGPSRSYTLTANGQIIFVPSGPGNNALAFVRTDASGNISGTWTTSPFLNEGDWSGFQLAFPVAVSAPTCDPPPSGIVSWWPGNSNILDIVSGNNGVLTNGATFAAGEVGQAFLLTNDHAAVVVGNPVKLQLQSFTIDAWVKRESANFVTDDPTASGSASIFSFGTDGYGFGFASSNGVLALSTVDVDSISSAGPTVNDTNFHHVAVTKSGSTVVFYVDGVASPSITYTDTFQFTTPAAIGARADNLNTNNNDSFFGEIDELEIFSRGLSSNEVAGIYKGWTAGMCMPAPAEITAISFVDTNPVIDFLTASSYFYDVQSRTNLGVGSWSTIATNIPGSGNPTNYIDLNGATVPRKFYRLDTHF